jgi:hypothetical protein
MWASVNKTSPILITLPFATNIWAAEVGAVIPGSFGQDFWEKVAIAIVAAVFGFIANYALDQLKRRREPRKQLSYEMDISKGLVTVQEKLKEKIKILYGGQEIRDVYSILCILENSGNTVVKNQYIRFSLPPETGIIDEYFEPLPEPELGLQDAPTPTLRPSERRYLITHMEKGQRVGFNFITAGGTTPELKLHPYNEAGDVDFVPRSITVVADEMHHVRTFIKLLILFWVIPPIFYLIPFTGSTAVGFVRLIIAGLMILHLQPFVTVLGEVILRFSRSHSVESRIQLAGLKEVDAMDIRIGEKE